MRKTNRQGIARQAVVWLLIGLGGGGATPSLADDVMQISIAADGIAAPASLGTAAGFGGSRRISADGRYVVFESSVGDLVPGASDRNTLRDVFLLDRQTGRVTLVSRAAGAVTTAADGESYEPVISADGAWVAFLSSAPDLIPGMVENNTAAEDDVFLWSRVGGTMTLVSHAAGLPSQTSEANSLEPNLSADGRFVVFQSLSQDLVTQPDANGSDHDVFLFDRLAPAASNVLLVSGSAQTGNGPSLAPALSGDGGWVAFVSQATDLIVGTDANGTDDVFLWERAQAGSPAALSLLSHVDGDPTTAGSGRSRSVSISADGGVVAFESAADDLVAANDSNDTGDVFVWRASSGTLALASHRIGDPTTSGDDTSGPPIVSADGSAVVFESVAEDLVGAGGNDGNGSEDVFHYAVGSGTVSLVSHVQGLPLETSDRGSRLPSVSDDGSRVIFESFSSDLTISTDTNGDRDVFAWQQATGGVRLLSRAVGQPAAAADAPSSWPEVSGDGTATVFESLASDLVPGAPGGLFVDDGSPDVALAVRRVPLRNLGAHSRAFDATVDRDRRQISSGGLYVVFVSEGANLVPGQRDVNFGASDVFLFDAQTGVTILVSHVPGQPLTTASSSSELPEISADGAWIVFRSRAVDLVTPSLPRLFRNHIYLYEVATRSVRLVTHVDGFPTLPGNRTSDEARLSADGRRIAIGSAASDLTPGVDPNTTLSDIFLYDVASGTMTRVTSSATGASTRPVIDDTGDHVAFESTGDDLVTGSDVNGTTDIFLWSRAAGTTQLVSHTDAGAGFAGNQNASQATISGDGSRIAFRTRADDMLAGGDANGTQADVFLFERATGVVTLVSHAAGSPGTTADRASNNPVISPDGRIVAFDSTATDLMSPPEASLLADVFRYDVTAGTLERVSSTPAGDPPNSHSTLPSLNGNGERVAYSSTAQDITSLADPNGALPDLFLFDAATGSSALVSRRFDGTGSGNATSERAQLSDDGSAVLFRSVAGDLMARVDNARDPGDVYLYTPAPTAVDLGVTLLATPGQVMAGAPITLELDVANAAAPPATRTVAVLDLPDGAAFQSASGSGWTCRAYDPTVVCDLTAPLTGSAAQLQVVAQMPVSAGPWTVRAGVKSLPQELDPTDNVIELTLTEAAADFGDAPAPFPTLLADDGARHGIVGVLHLGVTVEADADGQPEANALGDDSDGRDDEDGVSFPQPLLIGLSASIDIVASASGRLDAWFDWNRDGDWDDAGEKVFDGIAVSAGPISWPLMVPASAVAGDAFARFRLSSSGVASPTGPAADGEVEDYAVSVVAPSSLAIAGVTLAEGDAGTTPFRFTVSLTPASNVAVGVDFATQNGSADASDFQAVAGSLSFPPGTLQQTVDVQVLGDTLEEGDESFGVVLSNPTQAVVAAAVGVGTILDDDDQGAPGVAAIETGFGLPITDCGDLRQTFRRLRLSFDQPMNDPPGDSDVDDVTNPSNYLLVAAGPDAEFATLACGPVQVDDSAETVRAVSWRPDTRTAELTLAGVRSNGFYRLFACPDLRDPAGNLLDGDGDGMGGDPFVRDFRLSNGNLFVNGHFDDCPVELDPWEIVTVSANTVVAGSEDVQDSSLSGSAQFQVSESAPVALRQCVPAMAGRSYRLMASARFQPLADATANLTLGCEFFDDTTCGGSVLNELISIQPLGPGGTVWEGFEFLLEAPPQTASARCRVEVEPDDTGDPGLDVDVDDLSLGEGPIFADGFESGDTSAWDTSVP
ncbi:MAG: GEVED domain-containing protein [Acidobacteriota bacterium]